MGSEPTVFDELLEKASEGDEDAARAFFRAFATTTFFVPDRAQSQPLSDAPSYPNSLVFVLGIKDGDRVLVPFFTSADKVEEWCGILLKFREMKGSRLIEAIPEQWWGILNPGQEIQKEFSPWEIETMKGGEHTVDELVAELSVGTGSEPVSMRPVTEESHPELFVALRSFCSSEPAITQAFVAHEVNAEGTDEAQSILVGIEIDEACTDQTRLRQLAIDTLRPLLIGGEPLKVVVSAPGQEIMMGLLYGTKPAYIAAR